MVAPAQVGTTALPRLAERLKANCYCISLAPALLRQALASIVGTPDLFALLKARCPHLFSAQPVFMSDSQSQHMAVLVRAVE